MRMPSRLIVAFALVALGALVYTGLTWTGSSPHRIHQPGPTTGGDASVEPKQCRAVVLAGRPDASAPLSGERPSSSENPREDGSLLLSGRVVDEYGASIPAAQVRCYERSESTRPWDWSSPLATAVSGESGRWRLLLPHGAHTDVSLIPVKVGLAGQHTHVRLDNSTPVDELELCLFAAGSLRIRVLGQRQGTSGIRVGCVCSQVFGLPHEHFGRTDANGEYVFSDVVGQVRASIQEDDGVQFGAMAHVAPGRIPSLNFRFQPYPDCLSLSDSWAQVLTPPQM